MVPDSPEVQWIRPDPIVDSFLRTTLLGVALLWGGLFLVMIQGYGDCGSTAAEQAACERMWSESGERLRSVVLVVLGMTGLAVTAIARPRGRIPACSRSRAAQPWS